MKRKRPNPFDLYVSARQKPRSNSEPVWLILLTGAVLIVGVPQLPWLLELVA